MRPNVKLVIGLVLSTWIFTASANSAVVGRIEDFDGNSTPAKIEIDLPDGPSTVKVMPSAYLLLRGNTLVPVEFQTELQAGDVLVVNDPWHFLLIRFADHSEEKVTAKNSPYVVVAKGEVPSRWANFKHWVSSLTNRHQQEVMAVSVSTKGGGSSPLVMPLFEVKTGEPTKVLVAGKRSLYLAWQGGKADYQVTLQKSGEEKPLFVQSVTERVVQLPELTFAPGDYQLSLSDRKQRQVTHFFKVVDTPPPAYPNELTNESLASLSDSARRTVQAMWLAEQEKGSWSLEAYQRMAEIAKEYHFAKVLQQTLARGVGLKP